MNLLLNRIYGKDDGRSDCWQQSFLKQPLSRTENAMEKQHVAMNDLQEQRNPDADEGRWLAQYPHREQ